MTSSSQAGPPGITVATWNVCLGAEFEPILGAGSALDLREAARAVLDAVERSRFPDRADAIARVVAAHRPDVLALQELGRWETGVGDDAKTLYSFPDLVLEALARAGAPYALVTCVDTITGQLPVDATSWAGFTSCDALLVRKDAAVGLSVIEVDQDHYVNSHTVQLAGGDTPFPIRRGWSSVDLERSGYRLRVVVTHLDSLDAAVRRTQAHELVSLASRSPLPVVIVGDLNSPASALRGASPMAARSADGVLEVLAGAGYADAWLTCRGAASGHTWGEAPGLLAAAAGEAGRRGRRLSQRIDYVFFDPEALEARGALVLGADTDDVTVTEPVLVPSDHACVLAHLLFREAEPAG
jgi:endonuclease/exonuclease/phosphatase family metal-dependent hydrolase